MKKRPFQSDPPPFFTIIVPVFSSAPATSPFRAIPACCDLLLLDVPICADISAGTVTECIPKTNRSIPVNQDVGHESHVKEESIEAGESSGSEKEEANDTEENNEVGVEAELTKSLSKQRQRAIASSHRGRKTLASRNSYKDKGGRSSRSSKVQMQMSSW